MPWSRWIPVKPTGKQLAFLLQTGSEVLFGGSAGGGKSTALLMAALQYADTPGYSALLLRRTFADLQKPGALIPRSMEWLAGKGPAWSERDKHWRFPSGAILSFGYLEHENDIYQYLSTEYQFCAFDELTQFSEQQYRYLFSRLRRRTGIDVPLRMRSASNPGGIGHDWVKRRFMDEGLAQGRIFIRASLADNPHLDRQAYIKSLQELDPITRRQLLDGDWSARHGGSKFRREWFPVVEAAPAKLDKVRYWDLAGTEPKPGHDPDWTAGCLLGRATDGYYYVLDMRRVRASPAGVEALINQTAAMDGKSVPIWIEQEPGASGVQVIHYYIRVLAGYTVRGDRHTGSKEERANPVSSQAEAGNIKLLARPWVGALLDELEAFPQGAHDDQVDALSGAFGQMRRASLRVW